MTLFDLGAYASILGVVIAVVGFIITIKEARGARKVASEVRNDIAKIDLIAELSSTIRALEEIKNIQRDGKWDALPEKYASLRRSLISIKSSAITLSEDEKSGIQSTIQHLNSMEDTVEKCIAGKAKMDAVKFNKILSRNADSLHEILMNKKQTIERYKHG